MGKKVVMEVVVAVVVRVATELLSTELEVVLGEVMALML